MLMIKQVEFSSLPANQCLENYLVKRYDLEQFIIVYVDHVICITIMLFRNLSQSSQRYKLEQFIIVYVDHVICITIMLFRNLSQSSPVKQVKVGTKPGHSAHI